MSIFSGVCFDLVVNYLKSKVCNLRYDFRESSCAVLIDTSGPCDHFIDDFIDDHLLLTRSLKTLL